MSRVETDSAITRIPYALRQRFEYLERCLFWKGELQRADLTERFGVNPVQAATDFRDYMALVPGNMEYNKSRKRYLPLEGFTPRFIRPESLDEFLDLPSPLIPVEPWILPPRAAAPEILQDLVQAVRNREAIEIRYQSMTDPKASWRWISPHAFASDGRRWHVRAYCHTRKDFRDFVIGRIETTRKRKPSEIEPELDHNWHTWIDVTLIPNPALSLEQQEAIAYEYRMSHSKQLKLSVRKSLLFYLERQLAWAPETPEARQIVISYD